MGTDVREWYEIAWQYTENRKRYERHTAQRRAPAASILTIHHYGTRVGRRAPKITVTFNARLYVAGVLENRILCEPCGKLQSSEQSRRVT